MLTKQHEIWIADLNPYIGTEPGKTRFVLIIQSNLLNKIPHPSAIVCPLTTNVNKDSEILRIHLKKGTANLQQSYDIMVDELRTIDNKRLIKRIGKLPEELIIKTKENLQIIMDLE